MSNQTAFWVSILLALPFASSTVFAAEKPFDGSTVVASRGDAALLLEDVDVMVNDLPKDVQAGYMDSPERIERTLNGLLLARQIAAEGRKAGLDQTETFKRRMLLAQEAVLQKMQTQHYLDTLDLPDFEPLAKEQYLAHNDPAWQSPELRDVSHILISTENRTDDAAKALAATIRERLLAGEDFAELARTYSDDKKGLKSNGLLNSQFWLIKNLAKGKTEIAFEVAAWKLEKAGDISPLVKTKYGYHVLRLEGVTPSIKQPFAAVKDKIVAAIKAKWLEERKEQYIASFRAQELTANPEVVASLRTRYQPDEQANPALDSIPAEKAQQ